jgi:hypothetical protein
MGWLTGIAALATKPQAIKKALSELAVEVNYIESMVLPKEVNHAPYGFCRVSRSAQATHAGAAEATGSAVDGARDRPGE